MKFKKFDPYVCFFKEATIHTEEYKLLIQEDLFEYMLSLHFPLFLDTISLLKKLNKILKKYNITLKERAFNFDDTRSGIVSGKTKSSFEIIIFVSDELSSILKNRFLFSRFIDELGIILQHELVHRGQYLQQFKKAHLDNDSRSVEKHKKLDKKYYSNKHELMAMANMIIEELRFSGYEDDRILKGIKNKNISKQDSNFYMFYMNTYTNYDDNKVLNQLNKYIYQYLKEPIKVKL